ncbi:MAG TPA: hypothetical protein VG269_15160 [Tepidisphaeraceae bacterium]|nr:hypothetical protein [Tepidisphaeraceae bacterium]
MADEIIPYQTPKTPTPGVCRLGIISVALFIGSFCVPLEMSAKYFVASSPTYFVGFTLGLVSLLKTRGGSRLGRVGLILNAIPLIAMLGWLVVLAIK